MALYRITTVFILIFGLYSTSLAKAPTATQSNIKIISLHFEAQSDALHEYKINVFIKSNTYSISDIAYQYPVTVYAALPASLKKKFVKLALRKPGEREKCDHKYTIKLRLKYKPKLDYLKGYEEICISNKKFKNSVLYQLHRSHKRPKVIHNISRILVKLERLFEDAKRNPQVNKSTLSNNITAHDKGYFIESVVERIFCRKSLKKPFSNKTKYVVVFNKSNQVKNFRKCKVFYLSSKWIKAQVGIKNFYQIYTYFDANDRLVLVAFY